MLSKAAQDAVGRSHHSTALAWEIQVRRDWSESEAGLLSVPPELKRETTR